MKYLLEVEIKNYRTIENTTLKIDKQGIVSIFGSNTDDSLSPSIGAGKSTILSAICWNLFGVTPTGKKGDSILSWFNPKDCSVSTLWCEEFILDKRDNTVPKNVIQISRYRKHHERGDNVFIEYNFNKANTTNNKDAQSKIEEFLGFNYDIFCMLLTSSGSKKTKPFMSMTDTERKEFLDFLLNLEYLRDCYKDVQGKLNQTQKNIDALNRTINTKKSNITLLNEQIVKNTQSFQFYENERNTAITTLNNLIKTKTLELQTSYSEITTKKSIVDSMVIPVISQELLDNRILLTTKKNDIYSQIQALQESKKCMLQPQVFESAKVSKIQPIEFIEDKTHLESLNKELSEKTAEVNNLFFNKRKLEQELKELEVIDKYNSKLTEVQIKHFKPLEFELLELNNIIQNAKFKINSYNTQISKIQNISGKCPTCEQVMTVEKKEELLLELKSLIETENKIIKETEIKSVEMHNKIIALQNTFKHEVIMTCKHDLAIVIENLTIMEDRLKALHLHYTNTLKTYEEKKHNALLKQMADQQAEEEAIRAKVAKEIADIDNKISNLSELIKTIDNEILNILSLIGEEQSKINTITLTKSQLNNEVTLLTNKYKTTLAAVSDYKLQLSQKESDINPFKNIIEDNKQQLATLTNDCKNIAIELVSHEHELPYLEFWLNGFGNAGLKSYILDSITAMLNNKINYCLSKLSNNLKVDVCTQGSLKSGDIRDIFTVKIYNNGHETDYEELSTGERIKIQFAVVNYALKFVAEYYHNIKLNFDFYDEALDGLDYMGCECIINFLREMLERYTSIFMISHNENLKLLFDKNLIISKSNGRSALQEA